METTTNKTAAYRIIAALVRSHGRYAGDWSERSIRRANGIEAPVRAEKPQEGEEGAPPAGMIAEQFLQRSHPTFNPLFKRQREVNPRSRARGGQAEVFGHWMLPSGTLTGQLADHAESAQAALGAAGEQGSGDPIFDLMQLSGVIRIRKAGNSFLVVDIVRRPNKRQLEALERLGEGIEENGGAFQFQVLRKGDTGTLYEGTSVAELLRVPWGRVA